MQYVNLDKPSEPMSAPPSAIKTTSRRSRKQQKKTRRVVYFCGFVLAVIAVLHFLPFLFHFATLVVTSPKQLFTVIANQNPDLQESNGRVNILLLGIGGEGHDGPDLTDTIQIASIDVKTGETTLFSIPRDVWDTQLDAKVNAVYPAALANGGDGLQQTMNTFSGYTGLPISYVVRLDFNGFVKAVDLVGGIDVQVPHTFDDYEYPILDHEHDTCGFVEKVEPLTATSTPSASVKPSASPKSSASPSPSSSAGATHIVYVNPTTGVSISQEDVTDQNNPYSCRYIHIHFDQGTTHMDGTTALEFVRSRHGDNGEGSDFARSVRQQAVIVAFRNALISKDTLFNVSKVTALVQTFGQSVSTNITESQYGDFYQLYRRIKTAQIKSVALTDGSDGGETAFYHPETGDYGGGQWVLLPVGDNWSTVQQLIANALVASPSASVTAQPAGNN